MDKLKRIIRNVAYFVAGAIIAMAVFISIFFVPTSKDTVSYDIIDALKSGQSIIVFNAYDTTIEEITSDIICEPELFNSSYHNASGFNIGNFWIMLIPNNKYGDVKECQKEVEAVSNNILSELSCYNMSDYDKAFKIYTWICENIKYEKIPYGYDQDLYTALVKRKSVCMGLSKTFVYLLNKVGIDGYVVHGDALHVESNKRHTWTIAYLDGEPYCFDITSDLYSYQMSDKNKMITYEYFAITSEEMKKSCLIDGVCEDVWCNAIENNYFVKNNLYVASATINEIAKVLDGEKTLFVFKCASDSVYQTVLKNITSDEFSNITKKIYGKNYEIQTYENNTVRVLALLLDNDS